MKVDEWLSFFKHHREKSLFSLSDLTQLTGEHAASLSVQLTRLVKAGVLSRAAQAWYENPFTPPSSEEVAMVVRYPSYLSLEYALSKQGVLSQSVYILTLVTTKLPYTYTTDHVVYEYHQIHRSLFWGYQQKGVVLTAEPEKAFLDLIYIRCVCTRELPRQRFASLVNDMAVSEFDVERLHRYAEHFGPGTRNVLSQVGI